MARGRTRRLVGRLTRRAEFLAVAGTRRKSVAPGLIVQVRRHDARQRPAEGEPALRVGYTASKKVGGSVERNRARRRLRAAALEVLAPNARPGHDFVLIARDTTPGRPWEDLKSDLAQALRRLGVWADGEGAS
jgi:ribonuclease P protein component